jgi:hypothetical protein
MRDEQRNMMPGNNVLRGTTGRAGAMHGAGAVFGRAHSPAEIRCVTSPQRPGPKLSVPGALDTCFHRNDGLLSLATAFPNSAHLV